MATNRSREEPVYRRVLTTGADFEAFVDRYERPRYAIACSADDPSLLSIDVLVDEWLFSNDMDSLMRAFLSWDARRLHIRLTRSRCDALETAQRWAVAGLSPHFDGALNLLNSATFGAACRALTVEAARRLFFESIFVNASSYHCLSLTSDRYDDFVRQWKAEDERDARPTRYRAHKYFGVIVDAGPVMQNGRLSAYWVSIGWVIGRVRVDDMIAAHLTHDALTGQTCTINGLGEVEWIGAVRFRRAS